MRMPRRLNRRLVKLDKRIVTRLDIARIGISISALVYIMMIVR